MAWKSEKVVPVTGSVVTQLAFHPRGTRLLATIEEPTAEGLRLIEWDTQSWRSRPIAMARSPRTHRARYDGSGGIVARDETLLESALMQRVGASAAVSVAATRDGRRIAVGGPEAIAIHDGATGKVVRRIAVPGTVLRIAFSFDGATLASVGDAPAVGVWEVGTGRRIARLAGLKEPGWALAFSPDGRRLAAGGTDGTVWVWRK